LDALVSPPRVLPGQPPDQLANLLRDRRAPRGTRIGPLVLDDAPVPGEQGAGRHDPVQPKVPGQQPCQGGDHGPVGPVGPVRFRAGDRAAEDRNLMTSTKISASLDVSLRASSASQPNDRTMSR